MTPSLLELECPVVDDALSSVRGVLSLYGYMT